MRSRGLCCMPVLWLLLSVLLVPQASGQIRIRFHIYTWEGGGQYIRHPSVKAHRSPVKIFASQMDDYGNHQPGQYSETRDDGTSEMDFPPGGPVMVFFQD